MFKIYTIFILCSTVVADAQFFMKAFMISRGYLLSKTRTKFII